MKWIKIIFGLIIIAIGVTFAWLNATHVPFDYYFGKTQVSLSLLLALALGIGILLGIVIMSFKLIHLRYHNAKLKKRIKNAEQEVKNLRTIPIQDSH